MRGGRIADVEEPLPLGASVAPVVGAEVEEGAAAALRIGDEEAQGPGIHGLRPDRVAQPTAAPADAAHVVDPPVAIGTEAEVVVAIGALPHRDTVDRHAAETCELELRAAGIREVKDVEATAGARGDDDVVVHPVDVGSRIPIAQAAQGDSGAGHRVAGDSGLAATTGLARLAHVVHVEAALRVAAARGRHE